MLLLLGALGIPHEGCIVLCGLRFISPGLGLKACKVGLDHFEHTYNAAVGTAHALVGGHFRRLLVGLEEGLARVEILEYHQGLLHSCVRSRGIRNDVCVLRLLRATELRSFGHGFC